MKETAADSIYRQVRNKIIKGEYDNTFLIERDIALEFSVSRAPVRDALQRPCKPYIRRYSFSDTAVPLLYGKYVTGSYYKKRL